jgi:hypothetical protein
LRFFWLRALAAADFELSDVRPSRRVFEAAFATSAEVLRSGCPVCANVLAAADFDAAPVFGSFRVFEAALAAVSLVVFDGFGMICHFLQAGRD